MMKYNKNVENYRVEAWTQESNSDCGILPKEDVKRMLKGYKYDEMMDMYFTPHANKAYYIEEA